MPRAQGICSCSTPYFHRLGHCRLDKVTRQNSRRSEHGPSAKDITTRRRLGNRRSPSEPQGQFANRLGLDGRTRPDSELSARSAQILLRSVKRGGGEVQCGVSRASGVDNPSAPKAYSSKAIDITSLLGPDSTRWRRQTAPQLIPTVSSQWCVGNGWRRHLSCNGKSLCLCHHHETSRDAPGQRLHADHTDGRRDAPTPASAFPIHARHSRQQIHETSCRSGGCRPVYCSTAFL